MPLEERIKDLEFQNEKLQKYRKDAPDFPYDRLTEEFDPKDVEWRIQRSGAKQNGDVWALIVPYLQARAIMDRLDRVVGAHNWQNSITLEPSGVISTILIKINGEWVAKQDGAGFTEIESFKGGISDALKRAAVVWGIGRYLYDFEQIFADVSKEKKPGFEYAKYVDKISKKETVFYWRTPHSK